MKALQFAALLVLSLAAAPATAAEKVFCVGSDAELQQAFLLPFAEAIGTGGRASVLIKLRRRATPYVLASLPGSESLPFGAVTLKGGYSDDPADACSASGRILQPFNSRVDVGSGVHLWVSRESLVEGIALEGSKFEVSYSGNGEESVTLNTVRSALSGGIALDATEHSPDVHLRVVNSSIVNPGGPIGAGQQGCLLSFTGWRIEAGPISEDNRTRGLLANSTIAESNDDGLCLRELASFRATNSIVWANSGNGIRDSNPSDATPVILDTNVLQATNTIPGQVGVHVGGITADPLLLSNFQLAAQSPAVGSANLSIAPEDLPDVDASGNSRIVQALDRGAHERAGASADVIMVTTLEDPSGPPGTTSLFNAIAESNGTPGLQTIRFDPAITGNCNAEITLHSPTEIVDSVIIDGENLPGWSANESSDGFDASLCVKVKSISSANVLPHAFRVPYGSGATLTLRGLDIENFQTAVILQSGKDHVIRGNRFGNAERHILVDNPATARIGSGILAHRNHFNHATRSVLLHSSGNTVSGNLFGPDNTPQPFDGNGTDIELLQQSNLVSLNRIVESRDVSILARGSSSTIAANRFQGSPRAIQISDFFSTPGTGSDYLLRDNTLIDNSEGIVILDKAVRNRLVRNVIRGTDGPAIDLRGDGIINPNSNGGALQNTLANMGQNHPTLLQAQALDGAPLGATVAGELWARNGTYTIGFFANAGCDDTGHGEAEEPIGSTTVTVSNGTVLNNGTAPFEAEVTSSEPLAGKVVTATATDSAGNTSEFSACVEVAAGLPPPQADIFRDGFEAPMP